MELGWEGPKPDRNEVQAAMWVLRRATQYNPCVITQADVLDELIALERRLLEYTPHCAERVDRVSGGGEQ